MDILCAKLSQAVEGEYIQKAKSETLEDVYERVQELEMKLQLINCHADNLRKEFDSTVFPALKALNPQVLSKAEERLHVIFMQSRF